MICDWCKYAIAESQQSCEMSVGSVRYGKKSGQHYHSSDLERPYILHLFCVWPFVQRDQDILDVQREAILIEVRKEELEELKQLAFSEAAADLQNLCAECQQHRVDQDSPPEEYQCACGSQALPICPDCGEVSDLAADYVNEEAA